eukprot:1151045-Pelagomonas_calceolata.AAC.4
MRTLAGVLPLRTRNESTLQHTAGRTLLVGQRQGPGKNRLRHFVLCYMLMAALPLQKQLTRRLSLPMPPTTHHPFKNGLLVLPRSCPLPTSLFCLSSPRVTAPLPPHLAHLILPATSRLIAPTSSCLLPPALLPQIAPGVSCHSQRAHTAAGPYGAVGVPG